MVSQVTPGNSINDPKVKGVHTSSKFNLDRVQLQTARFGELTPCYAAEVTPKDVIPLRSSVDVRSYTLNAPLLSNISLKKDYFSVPLQAILPINWEKVFKNPKHGDDVIAENVNSVVSSRTISQNLSTIIANFKTRISELTDGGEGEDPSDLTEFFSIAFRNMSILESFLSSGSLLRNLGYDFSELYSSMIAPDTVVNMFDYDYEQFLKYFKSIVTNNAFSVYFYGDSTEVSVSLTRTYSKSKYDLSFHDFLQELRSNPMIKIKSSYSFNVDPSEVKTALEAIFYDASISIVKSGDVVYINFAPVIAYQMVAFHFYSNDNIDYIYSADLFRQLMKSYIYELYGGELPSFSYNGVSTLYDEFSGYNLSYALSYINSDESFDDLTYEDVNSINFWSTLLSFRRSLRYIDYFTGAKSQPLAVGDVNVAVNSNLVNVVDISRNIQRQRFLNAVNRIPQKIKDYIKEIFNIEPGYDYHDPAWLGHVSDQIRVVENENTGEGQLELENSVTSVFRSNSERYAFEFTADRPGYVIGIMYVDIPRAYVRSIDKCWLHVDRYDMFNPFMQFIGDQPIDYAELGILGAGNKPFAYTLRHMEYKQPFNFAAGGFVDNLPGWSFSYLPPNGDKQINIGPDFVRSRNSELDRFYVSLTGDTLASYFHFIIVTTNYCQASRPMAYSPSIL